MFQSIIVAAALFSKGATTRGLIKKAAKLLAPGGRITVVHVLEEMPSMIVAAVTKDQLAAQRKAARQQLEALAGGHGGIKVEIDLRQGKPSKQILESAEDNQADLIMIASHKPGLGDYFIGSTASRVVRHAQCSVLVSRRFV
jgi:universal stress protein F